MKKKYPISDHYDGRMFFNPGLDVDHSFTEAFKWAIERPDNGFPKWIENTFTPQLPAQINQDEAYVTFINHVTYLVQLAEQNILFDPVFCHSVSPLRFTGFERVRKPGLELEELPRIDVVTVSHNHFDHMDLGALKILHRKFRPLFVVPLGNARYFKKFGADVRVIELDWWDEHIENGLKISLTPAQHWSARGLFDRRQTLWGGFVIENTRGRKIYFMGDSGYSEKMFSDIQKKFGGFDLSFIPIGAYEPRWFMELVHLNPDEAVKSHNLMKSKLSIGMHFGTFNLTDERFEQPPIDLRKALEKFQAGNFEIMSEGETRKFSFG